MEEESKVSLSNTISTSSRAGSSPSIALTKEENGNSIPLFYYYLQIP